MHKYACNSELMMGELNAYEFVSSVRSKDMLIVNSQPGKHYDGYSGYLIKTSRAP